MCRIVILQTLVSANLCTEMIDRSHYHDQGGTYMSIRGAQTRERIKKKSLALFSQKGFKEVTMKDICEITGLSRGGLY